MLINEHVIQFIQFLSEMTSLFSWRDGIEIIFFSVLCYSTAYWFKQDQQKNLLGYFILYVFTIFTAYILNLSTITLFLYFYSPVIMMIFLMLHQKTLQKNLLSLARKSPITIENNWINDLIQIKLRALNNMQELICIIEQSDSIIDFLENPLPLNLFLTYDHALLLVESNLIKQNTMILISKTGIIKGINCRIKPEIIKETLNISEKQKDNNNNNNNNFILLAKAITAINDTIIIMNSPATRKFSVICNGKLINQLSADSIQALLHRCIIEKKQVYNKTDKYNQVKQKQV